MALNFFPQLFSARQYRKCHSVTMLFFNVHLDLPTDSRFHFPSEVLGRTLKRSVTTAREAPWVSVTPSVE
jgi:hypothetical protein